MITATVVHQNRLRGPGPSGAQTGLLDCAACASPRHPWTSTILLEHLTRLPAGRASGASLRLRRCPLRRLKLNIATPQATLLVALARPQIARRNALICVCVACEVKTHHKNCAGCLRGKLPRNQAPEPVRWLPGVHNRLLPAPQQYQARPHTSYSTLRSAWPLTLTPW